MSERSTLSTATFLAWALAAWCIISGILGIMGWDSDAARAQRSFASFFGQDSSPSSLIFAILYLVSGVMLLVASLGVLKPSAGNLAILLVVVFFVVRGVIALFVDRKAFQPNTLRWCLDASWYLVLILAAWNTRRS